MFYHQLNALTDRSSFPLTIYVFNRSLFIYKQKGLQKKWYPATKVDIHHSKNKIQLKKKYYKKVAVS